MLVKRHGHWSEFSENNTPIYLYLQIRTLDQPIVANSNTYSRIHILLTARINSNFGYIMPYYTLTFLLHKKFQI